MKSKPWIGWHFLLDDGYTCWNRTKVRVGSVMREPRPLAICKVGLHASKQQLDALQYAPGAIACLVELRGKRLDATDKSCATERKCLAKVDATKILHEFACWCAWRVLLQERCDGRKPDKRLWVAIRAKRQWLRGNCTDQKLAAARAAGAAGAATWDAARDAARAATWDAARAAARAAAWDARAATWDAAWDVENNQLKSMLLRAMGKTRRDL